MNALSRGLGTLCAMLCLALTDDASPLSISTKQHQLWVILIKIKVAVAEQTDNITLI